MAARREDSWDTASNREAQSGVANASDDNIAEKPDWLTIARTSFESSNAWSRSNLRRQWEANLRTFNNRHPQGSKYNSQEYKHLSKLFRPKTRATIRKAEAHLAQAFFGTSDMVNVTATDEDDQRQKAGADINKYLLNMRLDKKPIRWFTSMVGAYQDTKVIGICISKQFWHYEERVIKTEKRHVTDPETGEGIVDEAGNVVVEEIDTIEVLHDEPQTRLVAPENLCIDPAAHWQDPINTSPYVIERIPMYVQDVVDRMKVADPKTGQPAWIELSEDIIKSAIAQDYSPTRHAREDYREDSKDSEGKSRQHNIVWVHENVVRRGGEDWHFFTLGTSHLLSEAVPLQDKYLHRERPWVIGCSNLEAHRLFPSAMTELTEDLQQQANEIANQRIDNVRLAMNPRFFYKNNAGVDLAALRRSTPGGPVGMKHPGGTDPDVQMDRPPEVTKSAYAEQDRLNVDFDEIAGSFSTSSVQTNRQLNETVGGMEMLQGGASMLQDYDLRIFAETWVEPVLTQLVKLEQAYETDEAILAVAGKKAQLMQRFGTDEVTDEILQGQFNVRVNVGIGATDPKQRLDRFMVGATALQKLLGDSLAMDIDKQAVAAEVFGILGYRDGSRFFMWDDKNPRIAQMQKIIDELKKALEDKTMEFKAKAGMEMLKAKTTLARENMSNSTDILIEIMNQMANQVAAQEAQRSQEFNAATQSREAQANRQFETQKTAFSAAQALQVQEAKAAEARQSINGSGGGA
jgi:hypothetical protein